MKSRTKAMQPVGLSAAVAEGVGGATLYLAVVIGVMYQVAIAAGYVG